MKYIRTKYGIYNAIKEFKIGDMIGVPYNGLVKIIGRADTIEELCDEFVLECIDGHTYFHTKKETLDFTKMFNYKNYEIYGAIWTDKGLIYVAKMNEKGELELL